MSRDTVTLSTMAELQSHSNDWDSLPAQQATQADFYDTFAWFAAWWMAIESKEKSSFRVPAVLEGNRLLACLPLVASSTRRWESAGHRMRGRYRPVVGTELPEAASAI